MKDLYTLIGPDGQPFEPTDKLDKPDTASGRVFVVCENESDALDTAIKALREGVIVGLRKVSDVV